MSTAIFDDILDALKDGEYHDFSVIALKSRSNSLQTEAALCFLTKYGFVSRQRRPHSLHTKRAKLTPTMFNFLKRIKELEGYERKRTDTN